MTEQMDFLKEAAAAMSKGLDMAQRADNSEHYRETFTQARREWMEQAQAMALLSLAQDVRRVADALESVIENDSERVLFSAVRIWGNTE